MKISKGVEWAAHTCALLAVLPPDWALSKEALAEFLEVPPAYLAKQLQALSRAGIVISQRGAAGGYRLAKDPASLSLWDVTAAVEGTAPSFRCTEVRRNGPCGASPAECAGPCVIAATFRRAEAVYRQTLAAMPLTDVVAGVAKDANSARKQRISAWIQESATRPA
ncbi:MAG: Rrf2 family transcriptional regulator [Pseudomonadota bacterium]